MSAAPPAAYPVTERNKVRRLHERGVYDRAAVWAILDAQPLAHVAYVIDGEPYVTPTLAWREGDRLYWHGSSASRFLRKAEGTRVCVSVSLMDGYVLARSAFNHSVNYRSASLFGVARKVEGAQAKTDALKAMTDSLFPGRWETLRPMTAKELKATAVLWMDIESASAKSRAAPPGDADEAAFPVWAGVIPMVAALAEPVADAALPPGVETPADLIALARSGRLRGG